ncbi:N-acetylmuramoyl-L-alanine amidase [Rummeliibacillus sp. NPDC094406]|uniref:N-acetylmuramoyl-L-alanine amidase family protein n=1 Tax=Rummeliibacillus sp. NPDC094406 TaxID=3364511 RepID=UPI00380D85D8
MKKLTISLIIMTLVVSSVILIVNHQTNQGLLNNSITNHMNSNSSINNIVEQNKKPSKNVTKQVEKTKDKQITSKSSNQAKKSKNIVITIDPGHQMYANIEQEPVAPGSSQTKYKATVGSRGIVTRKPEYAITLEASKMLQKKLKKKGYQVFLTRKSNDVDLSNRDRAELANKHKSDLFIRVHADGAENSNAKGFSIIAPSKNNPYTKNVFGNSQKASKTIVQQVGKEFPLYQNGLSYRADLSGFNWSKVPVILVELGYVTNPEEDRNLSNKKYMDKLTTSIAKGVGKYLHENQK